MRCPNCGKNVPDGAMLCSRCGMQMRKGELDAEQIREREAIIKQNRQRSTRIIIILLTILVIGLAFIAIRSCGSGKPNRERAEGEVIYAAQDSLTGNWRGLWGYIGKDGEWYVNPTNDNAMPFSEGLSGVYGYRTLYWAFSDKYWGYVDSSMEKPIANDYIRAHSFSEGLASVIASKEKAWGFINTSGEFTIQPQYANAGNFVDGLAPVQDASTQLWGYLDTSGAWAIKPSYSEASDFGSGLAPAKDQKSGKWGYIDKKGDWKIDPALSAAHPFKEGLAAAWKSDNKMGYLDADGKWAIEASFTLGADAASDVDFAAGRAGMLDSKSGLWGYIDTSGKWVINPQFDAVHAYSSEGYAPAKAQGGEWGLISENGEWATECRFNNILAAPIEE